MKWKKVYDVVSMKAKESSEQEDLVTQIFTKRLRTSNDEYISWKQTYDH